jgi:hypothetical protein
LATVAVVLIPLLFGLASVVAAPPSKSTKANVPVSNLMEALALLHLVV